jgi:predicted  nucleic acid-binding Zn-ribbon protein
MSSQQEAPVNIAKLFELQKLDFNIDKTRKRVGEIRAALGESAAVAAARSTVAATEAEVHQWHATQKDAELAAQQAGERIRVDEKRLMSGEVRNAKELGALQDNITSMQRQRGVVEERGVEAMLMVEELNRRLSQERQQLATAEATWRGGQSELVEEENKLKRFYAQLKQQRDVTAAALDPASLKTYEQLRSRKNGIAIAPIKGSQCGVCNIQVPTGVISAARSRKDEPTYCTSCGRILFAN